MKARAQKGCFANGDDVESKESIGIVAVMDRYGLK
jgi:hypothetical protein